jgi:hypothetical protein
VTSAILVGILAYTTYTSVQRLGRRTPRAERVAAVQALSGRSA